MTRILDVQSSLDTPADAVCNLHALFLDASRSKTGLKRERNTFHTQPAQF